MTDTPDLSQKAMEMLDKLETLAVQMAPQAWELTLQAIQLKGIIDLGIAFSTALVGFLLLRFSILKFSEAAKDDNPSKVLIAAIGSVVALVGFLLPGVIQLLTSSTWIAAVSPEASLALRIIN